MIQIRDLAVALRVGLTFARMPRAVDPAVAEEEAYLARVKHPVGFQANASAEAA
jgi:hypothetical protein